MLRNRQIRIKFIKIFPLTLLSDSTVTVRVAATIGETATILVVATIGEILKTIRETATMREPFTDLSRGNDHRNRNYYQSTDGNSESNGTDGGEF